MEGAMGSSKEDLSDIEKAIVLLVRIASNGKYEKVGENYQFEFGEYNKYIVIITGEGMEFRLPVTKWIRGTYEPIETSELFKAISHKELKELNEEEALTKINFLIQEVKEIIK
jgi:hypothetical protein